MTVQELLIERKLTSALIVDDGYDTVPRADDLVADDEAWANFIADIGDDAALLQGEFPNFGALDATALRRSDEFVAVVWGLRGRMRPELWNLLFEKYEQGAKTDRGFLERLEERLKALGIETLSAGRTVPPEGKQKSIIFADLFLGATQQDIDIERTLERLKSLLEGRESNPPLVILMSRSNLLQDKKGYFRDSAKLLGAMFRVYSKQDLLDNQTLERTLGRLAQHHVDALRVAAFLHAWEKSLAEAAGRFLSGIRRLDLSDYSQIRALLLNFEGQPLGSYLLDVFDRVLQHEIEGDEVTITAAEALNSIDTEQYPAPYIAGSSDLQDLVYRSIWQHPKRLAVKGVESGAPVSFGDVLVKRSILNPQAVPAGVEDEPDALIVLTASCDLMREGGVSRIMLMEGRLAELTPKTWTYKGSGIKTPIIILPNGRRMWIQWDAKNIRMLLPGEITAFLAPPATYTITLRLRESHTLEVQQRLLSDMGRVGVVAHMPATFPVSVSLFTVDTDGNLKGIALPTTERDGGVCFAGRDSSSDVVTRLVMPEDAMDELLTAIAMLDDKTIHAKALDTLRRLKESKTFALSLQRGIVAPNGVQRMPLSLKAPIVADNGDVSSEVVGLIVRNPQNIDNSLATPLKHGAVILVLKDLEPEAVVVKVLTEGGAAEASTGK